MVSCNRNFLGALLCVLGFACAVGVRATAADVLAHFECREKLDRDWPRSLVTYQREFPQAAARLDDVRLVDAAGKEQPCQLWRVAQHPDGSIASARISFFAQLGKAGQFQYELRPGTPAVSSGAPTARREGDYLILDNGVVALRMPKPGKVGFEAPRSMSREATGTQQNGLPGPIQGVRLVDGRWVGGSEFVAVLPEQAPKATGYTCRISEQGPLFIEAVIRYDFAGGGWYQFSVRLLAGDPAVRLDEQFDLGEPGSMWDYQMVVTLGGGETGAGWTPDSVYWISPQNRLKGNHPALENRLRELGFAKETSFGSMVIPFGTSPKRLLEVAVRYPWNPNAHFFGLVDAADLTAEKRASEKVPFLGVVPMHGGNWRGSTDPSDGAVYAGAGGGVQLCWRLRASPHPRTMLHTGEYDPGLPLTFCRRQWALVGGSFQSPEQLWAFRGYDGTVSLDDYKDWILDWPEDSKTTYPRLLFAKADIQQHKTRPGESADAGQAPRYLYLEETGARREELWKRLTSDNEWSGPYGHARYILRDGDEPRMPWMSSYRQTQMTGWAVEVDELLSSDQLTAGQRARMRAYVAAVAYALSEPDINPRGSLTHLGTPNMPINRFCGLAWAAALIPDHPMSKTWLDVAAKYVRYKLAMNTAPNGTWGELVTYYAASAPHLMQTASVLARTGRFDSSTARLAAWPAQFTLQLLTPRDPRFGARIVPGWGHEGLDQCIQFLPAANAVRDVDRELSASLGWAWLNSGRALNGHHDAGFSPRLALLPGLVSEPGAGQVPAALRSAWLPGFGAVLRSHPGSANETYLALRQGYCVSHSDANQGDFVLYGRGAPLVSLALGAYPLHQHPPFTELYDKFGWHSRVRFMDQTNTGGWPGAGAVGGIPAHCFSDSVDYARARGDYTPQRWYRQTAMLKGKTSDGPTYLVLRDSFQPTDGDGSKLERKWWYLRTLGRKEQVVTNPSELIYSSPWGPQLVARVLQPSSVRWETRDASREVPLYFVNARAWRKAGSPIIGGENDNITVDDSLAITAAGPIAAGQDIMVALCPVAKGEAVPELESLAPGAVKAETRESTDYVFLGAQPMEFQNSEVDFKGIAGAVRVFPDEIHLAILEGPGTVSYKGTTLRAEVPAVRIIPIAELAEKRVMEQPAQWTIRSASLPEGCRIEGPARCELSIADDRVTGQSEGFGGFLHMPMPRGMRVLPMLVVDGRTFAPGTSGNALIIPLLPGDHRFEVRALEQPPVFRKWQAW
jgi:hypothetical protein